MLALTLAGHAGGPPVTNFEHLPAELLAHQMRGAAAARFREDWLPRADWVELDGIGHCPQLDVPLETAQLILGFTSR